MVATATKKKPEVDAEKAEAYKKELRRLHKKHKGLQSRVVLDEARDSHSPIHDVFEWDDTVAAEAHRLQQARELIGWVRLQIAEVGSREPTTLHVDVVNAPRAYHNVRDEDGEHKYVTIDELTADQSYREQLGMRSVQGIQRIAADLHLLDDCVEEAVQLEKVAADLYKKIEAQRSPA